MKLRPAAGGRWGGGAAAHGGGGEGGGGGGGVGDVEVMRDGSLLVSDDLAGAIYRISYRGK